MNSYKQTNQGRPSDTPILPSKPQRQLMPKNEFCAPGYQSTLNNGYFSVKSQYYPEVTLSDLALKWNLSKSAKLIVRLIGAFSKDIDSKTTYDLKETLKDLSTLIFANNSWLFVQLENFENFQYISDTHQHTRFFTEDGFRIPVIGVYKDVKSFIMTQLDKTVSLDRNNFMHNLTDKVHLYIFTSSSPAIQQNVCFECFILCNGTTLTLDDVMLCLEQDKPLIILRGSGGIADVLAECMATGKKRSNFVIVETYMKEIHRVPRWEKTSPEVVDLIKSTVDKIETILKKIHTPFQELNIKEKLNESTLSEIILKSVTDTIERIKIRTNTADEELNQRFLLLCLHLNQLDIAAQFGALWKIVKGKDPFCNEIVQEALKLGRYKFIRYMFVQGLGHEAFTDRRSQIRLPNKGVEMRVSIRFDLGIPADGLDYLFKKAILQQQHEFSTLIWRKLSSPIGAALFAYGMLKEMRQQETDLDRKKVIEERMKVYQKYAIETINITYDQKPVSALKLLGQTLPKWGNKSCIMLALETDNRTFVSQTACKRFRDLTWKTGSPVPVDSPIDETSANCVVCKIKPRKCKNGRCLHCFMREKLSPSCLSKLKLISHLVFLFLFAVYLLSLITEQIHPLEYLLAAWTAIYLVEGIYQVIKESSLKLFGAIEFIAVILFIFNWMIKWYAWAKRGDDQTIIDAVRVLFSLDFICYMLCTLEFFYIDKILGPLLRIMLSLLGIMLKFLLIILVFVIAYAIASESVLYPDRTLNAATLFNVFRRPFWAIFAEFRLEELTENCNSGNIRECTVNAGRGSPSHVGSYYLHPLMWIYFIIVNILVFSLLIAMFNSKIRVLEEQATEVWHHQFLQLTMKFYNTLFLPPPFTVLFPVLWIFCRRPGHDGPFLQEVVPAELTNLQRIEASGRYKFIQDIDEHEISVVCNGVLSCPHKDESKNKSSETKTAASTDSSNAPASHRRHSMVPPKDSNVHGPSRPKEIVQTEVTTPEQNKTLQEQIIDVLSYSEEVWGTTEQHAQFLNHLREMLNSTVQEPAVEISEKELEAEDTAEEEIYLNKEASTLTLIVPDMERPATQQDINLTTVESVYSSQSNLRDIVSPLTNDDFETLEQFPLENEASTVTLIVPDMERPATQQDINITTVESVNSSQSNLRDIVSPSNNIEFVTLGQPPLEKEGTTLSEIDI